MLSWRAEGVGFSSRGILSHTAGKYGRRKTLHDRNDTASHPKALHRWIGSIFDLCIHFTHWVGQQPSGGDTVCGSALDFKLAMLFFLPLEMCFFLMLYNKWLKMLTWAGKERAYCPVHSWLCWCISQTHTLRQTDILVFWCNKDTANHQFLCSPLFLPHQSPVNLVARFNMVIIAISHNALVSRADSVMRMAHILLCSSLVCMTVVYYPSIFPKTVASPLSV